jgi:diadenosine tetraphosphate (Ap4A) HIT family hydrolase
LWTNDFHEVQAVIPKQSLGYQSVQIKCKDQEVNSEDEAESSSIENTDHYFHRRASSDDGCDSDDEVESSQGRSARSYREFSENDSDDLFHRRCFSENDINQNHKKSTRSIKGSLSDSNVSSNSARSNISRNNIEDWDDQANSEGFLQKSAIYQIWKVKGIHALTVGKREVGKPFVWNLIPIPHKGWAVWHQLKIFINIIMGGYRVSVEEQESLKNSLGGAEQVFVEPKQKKRKVKEPESSAENPCAFCDNEVLNRQWVYKGNHVSLLISYKPVVDSKLHFLTVTHKHYQTFDELPKEVYLEICKVRSAVLKCWSKSEYDAFILNKSGKRAGQEVPHQHEHIILTKRKTSLLSGYARVLANILFAPLINLIWSGLSDYEQRNSAVGFANSLQKKTGLRNVFRTELTQDRYESYGSTED